VAPGRPAAWHFRNAAPGVASKVTAAGLTPVFSVHASVAGAAGSGVLALAG